MEMHLIEELDKADVIFALTFFSMALYWIGSENIFQLAQKT